MSHAPNARRILLVDDHLAQRRAMELALQAIGYEIFGAETAADALAAVGSVDVVLLEWRLADGDGVGLGHRLRSVCAAAGRTVRVAIVSTEDEPDGVLDAEGIDRYFTKPIDITEIARWIAGDDS